MHITYIITISPVLQLDYLNILIHSLNLQTSQRFNVIFYNQTLKSEPEIFKSLLICPKFPYDFYSIDQKNFLGEYPLWDLYGFHQYLLDNNKLEDYFMSLHMEEFIEPEYTFSLLSALKKHKLDILMGNLYSTDHTYCDIMEITTTKDVDSFNKYLSNKKINRSNKWGKTNKPFFLTKSPIKNLKKNYSLNFKNQLDSTPEGITILENYYYEDVYVMSAEFANKYQWFNSDIKLYFEDIHINQKLENELKKIIIFPAYFNIAKIYHLKHSKYYYQIENQDFSDKLLELKTTNPVLLSLKEAIIAFRNNKNTKQALNLSRKKGTVNINYKFHKKNILREILFDSS